MSPRASAVADLLRLPAVLTVPGDLLVGATWSAAGPSGRLAGLVAASSCFYLGGMALNDYADREADKLHRPSRPIPEGRVSAPFALGLAGGLSAAGLGMTAMAGGRRSLALGAPLATMVWAYDLALKQTALGPEAMAACRFLNVLMGVGDGQVAPALAPAALVGLHTLGLSLVSRCEAQGATPRLAAGALAGTMIVTVGAAMLMAAGRHPRGRGRPGPGSLAFLGAYAASLGRAELQAVREPSPDRLQRLVGTGVVGLMLLEAALLSGAGGPYPALAVGATWVLAKRLARRRPVT
ncbi:MAG: SCO3242 family prenyltransferase [Actinomycetota bacterium]